MYVTIWFSSWRISRQCLRFFCPLLLLLPLSLSSSLSLSLSLVLLLVFLIIVVVAADVLVLSTPQASPSATKTPTEKRCVSCSCFERTLFLLHVGAFWSKKHGIWCAGTMLFAVLFYIFVFFSSLPAELQNHWFVQLFVLTCAVVPSDQKWVGTPCQPVDLNPPWHHQSKGRFLRSRRI